MKNLWTALTLLLLILIFNICYVNFLQSSGEELVAILNNIEEAVDQGQHEKALALSFEFEENWSRVSKIYGAFLRHIEMNTIETSQNIAFGYLENKEYIFYKVESGNLKFLIQSVYDTERAALKNIL